MTYENNYTLYLELKSVLFKDLDEYNAFGKLKKNQGVNFIFVAFQNSVLIAILLSKIVFILLFIHSAFQFSEKLHFHFDYCLWKKGNSVFVL